MTADGGLWWHQEEEEEQWEEEEGRLAGLAGQRRLAGRAPRRAEGVGRWAAAGARAGKAAWVAATAAAATREAAGAAVRAAAARAAGAWVAAVGEVVARSHSTLLCALFPPAHY